MKTYRKVVNTVEISNGKVVSVRDSDGESMIVLSLCDHQIYLNYSGSSQTRKPSIEAEELRDALTEIIAAHNSSIDPDGRENEESAPASAFDDDLPF